MIRLNERADVRWARLTQEKLRVSAAEIARPATDLIRDLGRLMEDLDRCVPRLEQVGEAQIARETSRLCARTASLLHEIEAWGQPGSRGTN